MRKIALFLALIFCAGALISCGESLPSFKSKNGKYTVGKNVYVPSPLLYEPTSVGEAYAYYKRGDLTLYQIGEFDPALWLTEEYVSGLTTVFHAESITLPTLSQLDAEKIIVCQSESIVWGLFEIKDKELIRTLTGLYENGEQITLPVTYPDTEYELKFYSDDWPQIYMNLIYGEFPEGKFLYERASGRCVEVGDLLDPWLHPDTKPSGEAAP